jgi:tyrosyl-tRNA synthetase
MPLVDILIKNGMVASKSEFRRLVQEGAITFHGEIEEKKIIDPASLVDQSGALKIGKRRFLKITVKKDPK